MSSRGITVLIAICLLFVTGLFVIFPSVNASPAVSPLATTRNGSSSLSTTTFAHLPFVSKNQGASPSGTTFVYLPFVSRNSVGTSPLWRFGFTEVRRPITDYNPNDIASLRAGWYVDYGASADAPQPLGIEYVPTVSVKQWKLDSNNTWTLQCDGCPYVTPYTYTVSPGRDQIRSLAASRPGMTWIIGNEIERRDWYAGRQDEMLPEVYAVAYNELYTLIKQADPSAQVANGSLVLWSSLRQQYLDRVWNEYQRVYGQPMPVDVWNLHLFILPEQANSWGADIPAGIDATTGASYSQLDNKNFSIASTQMIQPFRTWLQQHGQQGKPLILTEVGVNMPDWVLCDNYPDTSGCPFTPEQVRDSYMVPAFNYFLNYSSSSIGMPSDGNRLVQRWIWWSLDDDDGEYRQDYCSDPTKGSVFCQYFGGNLMYSGMSGGNPNPMGVAPLGTYWIQYVSGLPSGSTKPYVTQRSSVQPSAPQAKSVVPSNWMSPATCADDQKITLQFVEPSPPGVIPGLSKQVVPPQVTKETTICAPVYSK